MPRVSTANREFRARNSELKERFGAVSQDPRTPTTLKRFSSRPQFQVKLAISRQNCLTHAPFSFNISPSVERSVLHPECRSSRRKKNTDELCTRNDTTKNPPFRPAGLRTPAPFSCPPVQQ